MHRNIGAENLHILLSTCEHVDCAHSRHYFSFLIDVRTASLCWSGRLRTDHALCRSVEQPRCDFANKHVADAADAGAYAAVVKVAPAVVGHTDLDQLNVFDALNDNGLADDCHHFERAHIAVDVLNVVSE